MFNCKACGKEANTFVKGVGDSLVIICECQCGNHIEHIYDCLNRNGVDREIEWSTIEKIKAKIYR